MEQLKCIGCGSVIQSEDKTKEGFIPASALEKNEGDVVCQRCFRLRHYNEIMPSTLTDDDFLQMLHHISEERGLVVLLVDLFDFNGSWVRGLNRFVGQNDILLIGNKIDLLPKSVNRGRIRHWLQKEASDLGLKSVDAALISSVTGEGIEKAMEKVDHYRQGKDVYIVGSTNVGKSTFINKIIEQTTGLDELITTSYFPGTTLGMVEIPLDDGQALIDTPGIINDHQIIHLLDERDLKAVLPRKEVKPKTHQLNEGQSLLLGGLAQFDFLSGDRTAYTVYVSRDIHVHRTKTEKAANLRTERTGELLTPPMPKSETVLPEFVRQEFTIREPKTDVAISGLGWITVHHANVRIAIHAPKGVDVVLRPSLV